MATRPAASISARLAAIVRRPVAQPWSIDVGAKGEWLDRRLYADVTAFYMKREDMQISTGVQLDPVGDPGGYFFLTDNASGGRNLSGSRAACAGALTATAGSRWHARSAAHSLLRISPGRRRPERARSGARARVPAFAQRDVAASARLDGAHRRFRCRRFLFRRAAEPDAQRCLHADQHQGRLRSGRWSVYAWGRNVFDEDYAVRGFYFGNEPPLFENQRYVQLGEPQQFGSLPDGSFVDAYRSRDQPVSARCRLHPVDQGVHRSSEHLPGLQDTTNAMSTQIAGEHARCSRSWRGNRVTFGERGQVFVMKVLGGSG